MSNEGKPYYYIRLLSLDVVAGAVGAGIMVSLICKTVLDPIFLVILGIAVWLIYTLDHLLDARRLGSNASTPRHLFHHHNFKTIAMVWLVLAHVGGGLALWQLEINALLFGLVMGGFTLLHLALVKVVGDRTSPFLIKESGVAFVYAAGVWGLPVIRSTSWEDPNVIFPFLQFLVLALVNLLLFSYFEYESDKQDGQTSFVRAVGKRVAYRFIGVLLLLLPLSELWTLFNSTNDPAFWWVKLILGLMWLTLAALWAFPNWFSLHERYRSWGDGAFLLPFLSILWIP